MTRGDDADVRANELSDAASSCSSTDDFGSGPQNHHQGHQRVSSEDPTSAQGWRHVFQGLGALESVETDYTSRNSSLGSADVAAAAQRNCAHPVNTRNGHGNAFGSTTLDDARRLHQTSTSVGPRYTLRPLAPPSYPQSQLDAYPRDPEVAAPHGSAPRLDLISNNYAATIQPETVCCDNPAFALEEETQLHHSDDESVPGDGRPGEVLRRGELQGGLARPSGRGPSPVVLDMGPTSLEFTAPENLWRRHCANPLYGSINSSGGGSINSGAGSGAADSVRNSFAGGLRRQVFRCDSAAGAQPPPPPLPPRWSGPRQAIVVADSVDSASESDGDSVGSGGNDLLHTSDDVIIPILPPAPPSPGEDFELPPPPLQQHSSTLAAASTATPPDTYATSTDLVQVAQVSVKAAEPEFSAEEIAGLQEDSYGVSSYGFIGRLTAAKDLHQCASLDSSPDPRAAVAAEGAGAEASVAEPEDRVLHREEESGDSRSRGSRNGLAAAIEGVRQRAPETRLNQLNRDGIARSCGLEDRNQVGRRSRTICGATGLVIGHIDHSGVEDGGATHLVSQRSGARSDVLEGGLCNTPTDGARNASASTTGAPLQQDSSRRSRHSVSSGGAAAAGQDSSRSDGSLAAALLLAAAVATGSNRGSGRSTAAVPTPRVAEEELLLEPSAIRCGSTVESSLAAPEGHTASEVVPAATAEELVAVQLSQLPSTLTVASADVATPELYMAPAPEMQLLTNTAANQCRSALQLLAGDLAMRLRAAAAPSDRCYCCYSHGGGGGVDGVMLEDQVLTMVSGPGQSVSPTELSSLRVQVEAVALLVSAVPYIATAAAVTTTGTGEFHRVDSCRNGGSAVATLRQLSEALLAAVSSGRCRRHHATQPCMLAAPLAHLAEALSGWTAAFVTGGGGAASAAASTELATRLSQCGAWLLEYSRQAAQNAAVVPPALQQSSEVVPTMSTADAEAPVEEEITSGCSETAAAAAAKPPVVATPVEVRAEAVGSPLARSSSPGDIRSAQRDRTVQRAASDAGGGVNIAAEAAKLLKPTKARTPPSLGGAAVTLTVAAEVEVEASVTVVSTAQGESKECSRGKDRSDVVMEVNSSNHSELKEAEQDHAAAAPMPPMMKQRGPVNCHEVPLLDTEEGHAHAIVVRKASSPPPLLPPLPPPPPSAAATQDHPRDEPRYQLHLPPPLPQASEVMEEDFKDNEPPSHLEAVVADLATSTVADSVCSTPAGIIVMNPFNEREPVLPPVSDNITEPLERQYMLLEHQLQTELLQPQSPPPPPPPQDALVQQRDEQQKQSPPQDQDRNHHVHLSNLHGGGEIMMPSSQEEVLQQLDRGAALLRAVHGRIQSSLPTNAVVLLAALPGPFVVTAVPSGVPSDGNWFQEVDEALRQVATLAGAPKVESSAAAAAGVDNPLGDARTVLAARAQLLRAVLAVAVSDGPTATEAALAAEALLRARLVAGGSFSSGESFAAAAGSRRRERVGLLAEAVALQGAVREIRGHMHGAIRLYDDALEVCRAEALRHSTPTELLLLRTAVGAARARCTVRLAALIPYAVAETTPSSQSQPAPTDPWVVPCPIAWYFMARPPSRSTRSTASSDSASFSTVGEDHPSTPEVENPLVSPKDMLQRQQPRRQLQLPSLAPYPCPRVAAAACAALAFLSKEFRSVCEALAEIRNIGDGGLATTVTAMEPPPLAALAEMVMVIVRLQMLAAAEGAAPSPLLQLGQAARCNDQKLLVREAAALASMAVRWLAAAGGTATSDSPSPSPSTAAAPDATSKLSAQLSQRHADSALLAAVCVAAAATLLYDSPLTSDRSGTVSTASTATISSDSSSRPIAAVLAAVTQQPYMGPCSVSEVSATETAMVDCQAAMWDQAWEWGKLALKARQELYGVDSEAALDAQAFLAHVAGAGLGLWHVAEPLLASLLALHGEKLGPAHPATQAAATYYLDMLLRHNRLRTAENVLRRLLPRALIHQRQLLQQSQPGVSASSSNCGSSGGSGGRTVEIPGHRSCSTSGGGQLPHPPTPAAATAAPSSPLPLLKLQERLEELKRLNAAAAALMEREREKSEAGVEPRPGVSMPPPPPPPPLAASAIQEPATAPDTMPRKSPSTTRVELLPTAFTVHETASSGAPFTVAELAVTAAHEKDVVAATTTEVAVPAQASTASQSESQSRPPYLTESLVAATVHGQFSKTQTTVAPPTLPKSAAAAAVRSQSTKPNAVVVTSRSPKWVSAAVLLQPSGSAAAAAVAAPPPPQPPGLVTAAAASPQACQSVTAAMRGQSPESVAPSFTSNKKPTRPQPMAASPAALYKPAGSMAPVAPTHTSASATVAPSQLANMAAAAPPKMPQPTGETASLLKPSKSAAAAAHSKPSELAPTAPTQPSVSAVVAPSRLFEKVTDISVVPCKTLFSASPQLAAAAANSWLPKPATAAAAAAAAARPSKLATESSEVLHPSAFVASPPPSSSSGKKNSPRTFRRSIPTPQQPATIRAPGPYAMAAASPAFAPAASDHAVAKPQASAVVLVAPVPSVAQPKPIMAAPILVSTQPKMAVAAGPAITEPKAATVSMDPVRAVAKLNVAVATDAITATAPPQRRQTKSPIAQLGAGVAASARDRAGAGAPQMVAATVAASAVNPQQSKTRPLALLFRRPFVAATHRAEGQPLQKAQQSATAAPGAAVAVATTVAGAMSSPAGLPQPHLLAFRRAAAALRRSAEAMDAAARDGAALARSAPTPVQSTATATAATIPLPNAALKAAEVTATATAAEAMTAVAGVCSQAQKQPATMPRASSPPALSSPKPTSLKAVAAAFKAGMAASPSQGAGQQSGLKSPRTSPRNKMSTTPRSVGTGRQDALSARSAREISPKVEPKLRTRKVASRAHTTGEAGAAAETAVAKLKGQTVEKAKPAVARDGATVKAPTPREKAAERKEAEGKKVAAKAEAAAMKVKAGVKAVEACERAGTAAEAEIAVGVEAAKAVVTKARGEANTEAAARPEAQFKQTQPKPEMTAKGDAKEKVRAQVFAKAAVVKKEAAEKAGAEAITKAKADAPAAANAGADAASKAAEAETEAAKEAAVRAAAAAAKKEALAKFEAALANGAASTSSKSASALSEASFRSSAMSSSRAIVRQPTVPSDPQRRCPPSPEPSVQTNLSTHLRRRLEPAFEQESEESRTGSGVTRVGLLPKTAWPPMNTQPAPESATRRESAGKKSSASAAAPENEGLHSTAFNSAAVQHLPAVCRPAQDTDGASVQSDSVSMTCSAHVAAAGDDTAGMVRQAPVPGRPVVESIAVASTATAPGCSMTAEISAPEVAGKESDEDVQQHEEDIDLRGLPSSAAARVLQAADISREHDAQAAQSVKLEASEPLDQPLIGFGTPMPLPAQAMAHLDATAAAQLDTMAAAVTLSEQLLHWPSVRSGPAARQQLQVQIPAPSLAASISALLASGTPKASPAPILPPPGGQTSPPSTVRFELGLEAAAAAQETAAPAVQAAASAGAGDSGQNGDILGPDVHKIGEYGDAAEVAVALVPQVFFVAEEMEEEEEEEEGIPMQPLQPQDDELLPSLMQRPTSSFSSLPPELLTEIAAAAMPSLPTESSRLLDDLPSPLQPRPSSMDCSAPVPLEPLPLEPLPHMQDPLPSTQPPLAVAPGALAADSPAMSWTSVGATVPSVGATEDLSAGIRVCPDTDIAHLNVKSLRGVRLRQLELGRGLGGERDGDGLSQSHSNSPLATGESPAGAGAAAAAAAAAATESGIKAFDKRPGGPEEVRRIQDCSESWRRHVEVLGPAPRPGNPLLRPHPAPALRELRRWRSRLDQPVATAAAAPAPAVAPQPLRLKAAGNGRSLSYTSAVNAAGVPPRDPRVCASRRRTAEPFEVDFDESAATAVAAAGTAAAGKVPTQVMLVTAERQPQRSPLLQSSAAQPRLRSAGGASEASARAAMCAVGRMGSEDEASYVAVRSSSLGGIRKEEAEQWEEEVDLEEGSSGLLAAADVWAGVGAVPKVAWAEEEEAVREEETEVVKGVWEEEDNEAQLGAATAIWGAAVVVTAGGGGGGAAGPARKESNGGLTEALRQHLLSMPTPPGSFYSARDVV